MFGFAVIYDGWLGKLIRTRVDNVKRGRVYVDYNPAAYGGRSFYLKSGANCRHPTGQTKLILPLVADNHGPATLSLRPPGGKAVARSFKTFKTTGALKNNQSEIK